MAFSRKVFAKLQEQKTTQEKVRYLAENEYDKFIELVRDFNSSVFAKKAKLSAALEMFVFIIGVENFYEIDQFRDNKIEISRLNKIYRNKNLEEYCEAQFKIGDIFLLSNLSENKDNCIFLFEGISCLEMSRQVQDGGAGVDFVLVVCGDFHAKRIAKNLGCEVVSFVSNIIDEFDPDFFKKHYLTLSFFLEISKMDLTKIDVSGYLEALYKLLETANHNEIEAIYKELKALPGKKTQKTEVNLFLNGIKKENFIADVSKIKEVRDSFNFNVRNVTNADFILEMFNCLYYFPKNEQSQANEGVLKEFCADFSVKKINGEEFYRVLFPKEDLLKKDKRSLFGIERKKFDYFDERQISFLKDNIAGIVIEKQDAKLLVTFPEKYLNIVEIAADRELLERG